MENDATPGSPWTSPKNASLLALVFQQVGLVMMIRYSRSSGQATQYLSSTAVVSAEILKLVLNLSLDWLLVQRHDPSTDTNIFYGMYRQLIHKESIKLAVPAVAYLVQNNLLFVALTHLTVPVYQVTNQGKLLTTALCSRLLLNKQISGIQYVSLAILAAGVALVQLSAADPNKKVQSSGEQNQLIGLLAVIFSCFTSGFAGVYFEKMLKSKSTTGQEQQQISVYMRNSQLALWSVSLGLAPVISKDWVKVQQHGFFQGYNWTVWTVIVCQAMTGLIVALVMKHADTILKGFATSVAVVVATVLSIFVFEASLDLMFFLGAAMVMWAVWLYTTYPHTKDVKASASDLNPCIKCIKKRSTCRLLLLGLLVSITLYGMFSSRDRNIMNMLFDPESKVLEPIGTSKALEPVDPTKVLEPIDLTCAKLEIILGDEDPQNRTLDFPTSPVPTFGKCPHQENKPSIGHYFYNMSVINQPRNCTPVLDVLAWIMDGVNCKNETMIIAYGGLIHMLREREFVRPDGKFIDDDIDLWVTPSTYQMIVDLEPTIFELFGWTLKVAKNCNDDIVFGQLFPVCGHHYAERVTKMLQSQPVFDIYILQSLDADGKAYRDSWQGTVLSSTVIFPPVAFPFQSQASNTILNLQVPAQMEKVLSCLYGNWSIPSGKHAGSPKCM